MHFLYGLNEKQRKLLNGQQANETWTHLHFLTACYTSNQIDEQQQQAIHPNYLGQPHESFPSMLLQLKGKRLDKPSLDISFHKVSPKQLLGLPFPLLRLSA